jgi:hypothetical protein
VDPVVDIAEKARLRFLGSLCAYRHIALTEDSELTKKRAPESSGRAGPHYAWRSKRKSGTAR